MDIKEVASFIGIEADNLDKFKEEFASKYIAKEVHETEVKNLKTSHGSRLGVIESKTKNVFKNLGVAFEQGELKDKSVEEIVEIGESKLSSKFEELSKTASGKAPEIEKVKSSYEEKLQGYEKKLKEVEGFWSNEKAEKEKIQGELTSQLHSFKINHSLNAEREKVKFKQGMTDIERKGFDALVNEKYAFKLGENDTVEVWDKAKNERVKDTKGYLAPASVLELEAKAQNLLELNGSKKQIIAPTTQIKTEAPERKIAPRLHQQG